MQKYQNLLWRIETECEKWNLEKRFDFDLDDNIRKSGLYDENFQSEYLKGFWIEENVGNNSFVFEEGNNLYVPPLKYFVGNKNFCSLRKGNQIAFRDLDENNNLIESVGLDNFILTQGQRTGVPIYFVDNHSWVFYCWAEWQKILNSSFQTPLRGQGGVKPQFLESNSLNQTQNVKVQLREIEPANRVINDQKELPILIHIDAHKDEGRVSLNKKLVQCDLASVRQQAAELKVSNYIYAAIQAGLIQSDFVSITESKNFSYCDREQKYLFPAAEFELLKKDMQNIILNVDLDFFDPEVSLISLEEKVKLIGYFAAKADLITFATSPGFVDQNLAIEVGRIFLNKL